MMTWLAGKGLAPFLLLATALAGVAGAGDLHRLEECADQLTVFTIPSPHGIDWASPRALAIQGVKNQLTLRHFGAKHFIGHVFVHLQSSSTPKKVLTGMTTFSSDEEIELVRKHRYGLGVLAADMVGKLEKSSDLWPQIEDRYESGLISWIRFKLSPSNGARLRRYYEEYVAKGCDKHYGGANRPRYGEGAGCSAFGISFIDVAGLMEKDFVERWRLVLRIPVDLFGGPHTGKRIPLLRILAWDRWAAEDEPHVKSLMWDPTLMFDWIQDACDREAAHPTGRWTPETRGRARGLVVDARHVEAPSEPIWLEDARGLGHAYGRQCGCARVEPVPHVWDDTQ